MDIHTSKPMLPLRLCSVATRGLRLWQVTASVCARGRGGMFIIYS